MPRTDSQSPVGAFMTRTALIAIFVALAAVSSLAAASQGLCTSAPISIDGADYLSASPSKPDSTQDVAITVGRSSYIPQSAELRVHGTTIDVTLTASAIDFLPPPPICVTVDAGPLPSAEYEIRFFLFDPTAPAQGSTLMETTQVFVTGPPGPLSGLWWNPGESGWGIHLAQRGSNIFASWFTYDQLGNAKWYVASNCVGIDSGLSGTCSGAVYQVVGPRFFGGAFTQVMSGQVSQAGNITLQFSDADHGTLSFAVSNVIRSVPIVRQVFPVLQTPPTTANYTDLWWNPDEAGWGLALTQQGVNIFAAWYVYDADGNPSWLVVPNCALNAGTCTGAIYRTTGPTFGTSFDPRQVRAEAVGTMAITFTDANNAAISYTVNGQSGGKAVVRQVF